LAFIVVNRGNNQDAGKVFTVSEPVAVIGRLTSLNRPDIELSDDVVSRRHAEIVFKDGKYWIQDLGSTNGTMLNDDRILSGSLYELKHNSRIGLGMEGSSARIILIFKQTEDTNIIRGKQQDAGTNTEMSNVTWLKIDDKKKEVSIDGKPKKLSRKEYELLSFLYRNTGDVCSRDRIIEAVWSESKDPSAISDATIDQLIHRLREKVEPDPANPTRIISKKAFGYMLV
jgi:pSer/pThr/pTyr-binding forkhead associated (FHA) protein